jgi:Fur family zinc uptake transcriptional regulator
VLKTLIEAGRPMTAYEVVQRLGGIGAMNAPTAYRALDFLEALGLIRKITSLRKYVVLRSGPTHEPLVFGICEACGAVQEIEDTASLNSLVVNAQTAGFATRHLTVELKGLCLGVACSLSKPAA